MGLQSGDEERQFSREDLLTAWLERRQFADKHVDLSTYHGARIRAFSAAFGVELDELDERAERDEYERRWHYDLFRKTADDHNSLHNPFSDYLLEGPEGQFSDPHAGRIRSAADGLRDAYRGLLLDLMEEIWDLRPDRRVTAETLRHHGFDPSPLPPIPEDYW